MTKDKVTPINRVINKRAINKSCEKHGCGRYNTDWVFSLRPDATIHQKTAREREALKLRKRGK